MKYNILQALSAVAMTLAEGVNVEFTVMPRSLICWPFCIDLKSAFSDRDRRRSGGPIIDRWWLSTLKGPADVFRGTYNFPYECLGIGTGPPLPKLQPFPLTCTKYIDMKRIFASIPMTYPFPSPIRCFCPIYQPSHPLPDIIPWSMCANWGPLCPTLPFNISISIFVILSAKRDRSFWGGGIDECVLTRSSGT